jgi:hypothetical protein
MFRCKPSTLACKILVGMVMCGLHAAVIAQPRSVYTVDIGKGVQQGQAKRAPNHPSYDVAVIKLNDDGAFSDAEQLEVAARAITTARSNSNGAIVVVFIHGWHHNGAWDVGADGGDSHFRAFRQMLAFIALREAERYFVEPGGRRVVGVYVAWNGDPPDSWLAGTGPLTHLSFWNRYATAKRIGEGAPMRSALRTIVQATKDPLLDGGGVRAQDVESPLILIGHSMGALMLESAFLSLIRDSTNPLVRPASEAARIVEVRRDGERIRFPDVLIALNSAADSVIHREIRQTLASGKYAKRVGDQQIGYAGPLLISATSSADNDTKVIWRGANILWPGRTTDGHDETLFTHRLVLERPQVTCNQRNTVDFGQNWHCLRFPEPANASTPHFPLDLPTRDRLGKGDVPPFARYRLVPLGDIQEARITWVFQIPPEVVSDHNDIFNSRASSLTLALIQISGAIMSLAQDWRTTFE